MKQTPNTQMVIIDCSIKYYTYKEHAAFLVMQFFCAFAKLRYAIISSATTGRILRKFYICDFFRKYVQKIQMSLKSDKNNGCFTWRRFHIYDNISLDSS